MRQVYLVGAGVIAETHIQVLKGIDGVAVGAIVDPDQDKARRFAARWGVERTYPDSQAALSAQRPDCVHILVPPDRHYEAALPWIEAGIPTLIEKPAVATPEQAVLLEAAAKASGTLVGVNHNFMHHPAFVRLRNAVENGELGPARALHLAYNVPLRQLAAGQFGHWMFDRPVNLLLEQAVHPLSQILQLSGPITAVAAQATAHEGGGLSFFDGYTALLSGSRLPATLQFAVGRSFPHWQVTVVCDDGVGTADILNNRFVMHRRTRWLEPVDMVLSALRTSLAFGWEGIANARDYAASLVKLRPRSDTFFLSMTASIREFHGALSSGRQPLSDLAFSRDLIGICDSMARQAAPAAETAVPAVAAAPAGPPDVAVLGGTGFIGRRLVERLLKDGKSVSVLARNTRNLPTVFSKDGVRLFRGDVRDPAAVSAAIDGAPVVVNLAHGGGGGSREQVEAAMVGSATLIAELCLKAGVRRLVHIGSIAGLYLGEPGEVITGAAPPDPLADQRADYARAKALADVMLLHLHRERNLPVVILRPGLVLGKGTSPFHSGLGVFNNEQHCLGWNMGKNPLPFVLVDDVADAIAAACEADGVIGKCYNLAGDVVLSAREYIALLGRKLDRPLAFHPQPVTAIWLIEILKWVVKRGVGRSAAWPYLRDLKSRGMTARLDCGDAKQALGWNPLGDAGQFIDRAVGGGD